MLRNVGNIWHCVISGEKKIAIPCMDVSDNKELEEGEQERFSGGVVHENRKENSSIQSCFEAYEAGRHCKE